MSLEKFSKKNPKISKRVTREITADAILIQNGKILLDKRLREPFRGVWGLPGGHVEFNETVEQACLRELKEETNLDVEIVRLFGIFSNPDRDEYQRVTVVYEVTCDETSGLKAGDDASEVGWFDINNLPDLAFDHEEIVSRFIST